jgi:hypothetical protein
MGQDLA